MDEARKLIQCLKGKNVIGGDVACLMPTKDSPNQITAMVAASIMFEIICLISVYRNKQFSFKINSDALSAIINVGAFRFPLVISGITDASTTLRFSTP